MNRQHVRWLASLVPIEAVAKQKFEGDIETCKFQMIVYECIWSVGVDSELFVDIYQYECLVAEGRRDEIAKSPIRKPNLVHGNEISERLQEKHRELRSKWYDRFSQMRKFQRDELFEQSAKARKLLQNAVVELIVELGVIRKEIVASKLELDEFMSEYGSKPEYQQQVVIKEVVAPEKGPAVKRNAVTTTATKKGAQQKKPASSSATKRGTTRRKK